jgi:sorbose reductase
VKVKTYQVDVQKYDAVENAVNQAVKDFGRLDVMIANAGVPSKAGGLDDKVEDWDRVRAIDFDGAYYSVRAAGLVFRKQGHGTAVMTASMSGHAANVPQEQSCYNACKAGVVSFPSQFPQTISLGEANRTVTSDPPGQVSICRVG